MKTMQNSPKRERFEVIDDERERFFSAGRLKFMSIQRSSMLDMKNKVQET